MTRLKWALTQTQQAVFDALIKMLDQASPVTDKEQSDESNI